MFFSTCVASPVYSFAVVGGAVTGSSSELRDSASQSDLRSRSALQPSCTVPLRSSTWRNNAHTRNPCQRLPDKGLDISFCSCSHTELWSEQAEDLYIHFWFTTVFIVVFAGAGQTRWHWDTEKRQDQSCKPGTNDNIPATRGHFGLL